MPNIKQLKALKKLMQEQGLLKQVEKMATVPDKYGILSGQAIEAVDLAKKRGLGSLTKSNLRDARRDQIRQDTLADMEDKLMIKPDLNTRINRMGNEENWTREARAIRNRDELINNYDIDEKLANYPSKNLEDNMETRKLFHDQESIKEYSPNDWERIRALLEKNKSSK